MENSDVVTKTTDDETSNNSIWPRHIFSVSGENDGSLRVFWKIECGKFAVCESWINFV